MKNEIGENDPANNLGRESAAPEVLQYTKKSPEEIAAWKAHLENEGRVANREQLAQLFRDAISTPESYRREAVLAALDAGASQEAEYKLLPAVTDPNNRDAWAASAIEWFASSNDRYWDIAANVNDDDMVAKAQDYADIIVLGKKMQANGEITDYIAEARRLFHAKLSLLLQGIEDDADISDYFDGEAISLEFTNETADHDSSDAVGTTDDISAGKGSWSAVVAGQGNAGRDSTHAQLIPAEGKGSWKTPTGGPPAGWAFPSDDKRDWKAAIPTGSGGGDNRNANANVGGGKT